MDSHSQSSKDMDSYSQSSKDMNSNSQSSKDVDSHCQSSKDMDSHSQSSKDTDSHSQSSKDTDSHSQSSKDTDSHSQISKDIDSHSQSSKDVDSHSQSSKDVDSHSQSSKDMDSHSQSSKDMDSHSQSSEDMDSHSHSSKDMDSYSQSSKDMDSSSQSSKDMDAHSQSSKDMDAHSQSSKDIDSHPQSSKDIDSHSQNLAQEPANKNMQHDGDVDDMEVREIIEIIANTGKFWHDWDFLKALLSYRLKQVLAEYPESKKETATETQANSSSPSHEAYTELVKRLDEALQNFMEGPPFTLQRFCEILLNPKGTYPKLSKLALALEKNLLVTSTLSICTVPYVGLITGNLPQPRKVDEETQEQVTLVQNGGSGAEGVVDVEMVDAVTNDDNSNHDVKMQEDEDTPTMVDAAATNNDDNSSHDVKMQDDMITETSEVQDVANESNAEIAPVKEGTGY